MRNRTRREFLADALIVATAAGLSGCSEQAKEKKLPPKLGNPSDRIGIAVLGVRGFGKKHIAGFGKLPNCELLYIVDPDEAVGRKGVKKALRYQKRAPKLVADLRYALDDPKVDVVSIATPDHWHGLAAIWAMQAGKDVYVEKPVSLTVGEGRQIVTVARKLGRICQSGLHRRSFGFIEEGVKQLNEGVIGELSHARCLSYLRRKSIGPPGKYSPPSSLNYDLWLGPAKDTPLTRKRFHYDWHWLWEYGTGGLGNNGVHRIDVARWMLGLQGLGDDVISYGGRFGPEDAGETPNTQVVIHQFGKQTIVQEVRGLPSDKIRGVANGVIAYGEKGYMVSASGKVAIYDLDGKNKRNVEGKRKSHFGNFINAVVSKRHQDLNSDIEDAHFSSSLCHIGNISYRVGQQAKPDEIRNALGAIESADNLLARFDSTVDHLKKHNISLEKHPMVLGQLLKLDSPKETFVDASEANKLLVSRYRAPYTFKV